MSSDCTIHSKGRECNLAIWYKIIRSAMERHCQPVVIDDTMLCKNKKDEEEKEEEKVRQMRKKNRPRRRLAQSQCLMQEHAMQSNGLAGSNAQSLTD